MNNRIRVFSTFGFAVVACACLHADEATTVPLTGKVTDREGRPVPRAVVECYQYDESRTFTSEAPKLLQRKVTDTNGAFEMSVSRTSVLLLATSSGLAPAWRQLAAKPGAELNLTLTTPAPLAGVVVDEADQPVADADVYASVVISETLIDGTRRSYNYLVGELARDRFHARTSIDGRFRIEGLPSGASADLAIDAPGQVLRAPARDSLGPDTMQCQAGQEDLRLVTEPAGSIEGKIVADRPGESTPVAQLSVLPNGPGMFRLAARKPSMSQADGTFRIQDLTAGSYRIQAVFGTNALPDWVANTVPVSVESKETTLGVELTATRGGLLQVSVFEETDREPLSQVSVHAYGQEFQSGTRSDEDGVAVLRLPPGDYQVRATRQNWIADTASASVDAGRTNRVEVEMAPPPRITGVVRRPNGQPAAGLKVQIVGAYRMDEAQVTTDDEGRFEVEWNPQRYGQSDAVFCLLIRDPDHNLAVATDIDEDTETLELQLEPGVTLAGRVECDGKPLTNSTAALVFWTGNRGMHLSGLAVGTDTPGQFEIRALPSDRSYGVHLSAPGYGQQYVDARDLEEEAGRIELEAVELKPANLELGGQVVDADDEPVARATVHLSGEGQPSGSTRTDNAGRFHFNQVCEGVVRLYVSAQGTYGNTMAEAGDTNVVLQLGESSNLSPESVRRKLTGLVSDLNGQPVPDARVSVFPEGSSRWVKTDAKGAFKLNWTLQPWQMQSGGDPCLVVRDLVHNLAAAEDILEDDTNLNVTLTPGLTLTGRVENVDGEPLAKAQVGIWLLACNTYSQVGDQPAATDANGGFEIKTLPPGLQYRIYAMAKDHGRSQRGLDQDSETNCIELEPFVLKRADQVIEGRVVDEDEKPLSGVNVHLSGDDQPQDSDTTDSKGRFSFKVCEGTVRLFASSQRGYSDATAEAGDTNVVIQLTPNQSFGGRTVRRASLKGKPLPDLSPLGLAADAVPMAKSVLLCLVDVEQRPSRHVARLLIKQQPALRQMDVALVIIQAAAVTPESLDSWKTDNAVECPVGRVEEDSAKVRWATAVEALPWLILTDRAGNVAAEGFPLDELDNKLDALSE